MKLSLSQAAEQLGKTRRQIRYMIQEGRLEASKEGGRWSVDSGALPLDGPRQAAQARRLERLRDVPTRRDRSAQRTLRSKPRSCRVRCADRRTSGLGRCLASYRGLLLFP